MTSQYDPNAGLVLRRIEELFTRTTYRLFHLTLRDSNGTLRASHGTIQTLHTTAEHPPYALDPPASPPTTSNPATPSPKPTSSSLPIHPSQKAPLPSPFL